MVPIMFIKDAQINGVCKVRAALYVVLGEREGIENNEI